MSSHRDFLTELINDLKQQRDELALHIHLGKAEAKEEWEKVQVKLEHIESRRDRLKEATEESVENVLEALRLVGEEIKNGFERIRKLL